MGNACGVAADTPCGVVDSPNRVEAGVAYDFHGRTVAGNHGKAVEDTAKIVGPSVSVL